MRGFMTFSSSCARFCAPKNTNASSGIEGMRRIHPRSHVPREPGGNWHHMIRLFPDPVVVASAGPLPSATLHEIRHCSGNDAGTTNHRPQHRLCQEILEACNLSSASGKSEREASSRPFFFICIATDLLFDFDDHSSRFWW